MALEMEGIRNRDTVKKARAGSGTEGYEIGLIRRTRAGALEGLRSSR